MAVQELIQYIKTQLQNGQSEFAIKSNLLASGWQLPDIEAAFQSMGPSEVPLKPQDITPPNTKTKHLPLIPVLIVVVVLILGIGGFVVFSTVIKNQNQSKTPVEKSDTNNTQSVSSSSSTPSSPFGSFLSPAPSQETGDNTLSYSSVELGYSFKYPKSWKVDKQGTLTTISNLQSPNANECAAVLEKLMACDVFVSSAPYQENVTVTPTVTAAPFPTPKPKADQVKDLVSQISTDKKTVATTVGALSGYEVATTSGGESVFNVVLQGAKNIILVQFPNKKSRSELTLDQLSILDSVVEQ